MIDSLSGQPEPPEGAIEAGARAHLIDVMAAADLEHQQDGFARQLVHDDWCCMEAILDALLPAFLAAGWLPPPHRYTVDVVLHGTEQYPCVICGKFRQEHEASEPTGIMAAASLASRGKDTANMTAEQLHVHYAAAALDVLLAAGWLPPEDAKPLVDLLSWAAGWTPPEGEKT